MSDWKNVQYKDGKMRTSEGGGGGSSTFAGLDDVSFNNIQNGQVPKYNSTTQKWENADESGGGGTVTDVEVDGISVVNSQGVAEIETPNASGIEYNNQQSSLSATDVQSAIDELAQGGGGASTLAGLTDVNLTDIQDGQIIKWDDATQKFVNADESGGSGGGATISEESLYVATSSATGTYALSKSIDNFDFIAIWYGDWAERTSWGNYVLYSVESLNANHDAGLKISVIGYGTRYNIIDIYGTTLAITTNSGQAILEVRGIKISGNGTNSNYKETVIYTGNDQPTYYELTQPLTNFDAIAVYVMTSNWYTSNIFLVSELMDKAGIDARFGTFSNSVYIYFKVIDANTLQRSDTQSFLIYKIIGLNFGLGGSGTLEITYNSADGNILDREYLRKGEDALFNYFHNVWSDEQGGTPITDVTKNVQTDLELFYARSDAKMYLPLFQKMQSDSSSAIYVADKRCTVLAINSETLHETTSFTTVTTITTTGTVIDTINNHVDTAAAPLCCGGLTLSIISLNPGDSITFETSSRTSNDERFFGVFECDGISEFTNKTFLCPRDGEYQSNTITYTAESDEYYLCFAEQLSRNDKSITTNILVNDTALPNTDYYLGKNQNYEQMRIGLVYCETGDVIKLQTNSSISGYVGNMFGIYLLN